MDIYCPKCGEPWDMDSLHDEISHRLPNLDFKALSEGAKKFAGQEFKSLDQVSPEQAPFLAEYKLYRKKYDEAYRSIQLDFRKNGCIAFTFAVTQPCEKAQDYNQKLRADASSALMDIMGDDLDGVAAMLDDAHL